MPAQNRRTTLHSRYPQALDTSRMIYCLWDARHLNPKLLAWNGIALLALGTFYFAADKLVVTFIAATRSMRSGINLAKTICVSVNGLVSRNTTVPLLFHGYSACIISKISLSNCLYFAPLSAPGSGSREEPFTELLTRPKSIPPLCWSSCSEQASAYLITSVCPCS
jgi:hypothetical protein